MAIMSKLRVRYVPAARLVLLKGLFPSLSTRLTSKIGGVASHYEVITIIALLTTWDTPFQNDSWLMLLIHFLMNFVLYTDGLLTDLLYLEYNVKQQATFWPVCQWLKKEDAYRTV